MMILADSPFSMRAVAKNPAPSFITRRLIRGPKLLQSLPFHSLKRRPSLSITNATDVVSPANAYEEFRGKIIIVTYGSAIMGSEHLQSSFIDDLVLLSREGLRPVFVHGGGLAVEFTPQSVPSDAAAMDWALTSAGGFNLKLVSHIQRAGGKAAGLVGVDGRLFTARPGPNAKLGHLGEVAEVDPHVLLLQSNIGIIPVIASISTDAYGKWYVINADTVAAELAAALGAEKLILLTDGPGILRQWDDPKSLVKKIDAEGVKKMLREGQVADNLIRKVNCCVKSLAYGVRTASIIDARVDHTLDLEFKSGERVGTIITGRG